MNELTCPACSASCRLIVVTGMVTQPSSSALMIGSAMGADYRHTTPEMAAHIATAIEQRLKRVLEVAEQALEAQPHRSTQRVF
jgi:hypothetical protein